MYQRTILTILIFVSSTAFAADFTGTWMGSGKLGADYGQAGLSLFDCGTVKVDVIQTAIAVDLKSITYDCTSDMGDLSIEFAEMVLTISGTDLMLDGNKIGEITDTKITLDQKDDGADYHTVQTFEITDQGMVFTDKDNNISDDKVIWDFNSTLALPTAP